MAKSRDQELEEIPLLPPFKGWPKGVRGIGITEADGLGVNTEGELYWRGKPVEIRRPLDLTIWQKLGAILVTVFTVIAGVGAAAQGWTAYNDWACKIGWRAVCPAAKTNEAPPLIAVVNPVPATQNTSTTPLQHQRRKSLN